MTTPEKETKPTSMTGSCLCGKITYTVTGAPTFSCICHCSDCQKASSSAFIAILGYPKQNFTIHNPETALESIAQNQATSYKGTPKTQSFCRECGSIVFGGVYGEEEWHTVYSGTLDAQYRECWPPTIAMFTKDRPKWAKIEGLQEFEGMPPQ